MCINSHVFHSIGTFELNSCSLDLISRKSMASTECNGELHSASSPKENTSSSCESSGSDSEGELLQKAKDTATTAGDKTDSCLSRLFRFGIIVWLLVAYLACCMVYSLITPFYPEKVALYIIIGYSYNSTIYTHTLYMY